MNNLWFVTFGDDRLTQARRRIRRQAELMGVFGPRIRIFGEKDLDLEFRERMRDRLVYGSRGFGFWCWKPQVVLQVLREMEDGDVLLYADIGSHLNPKGLKRLEEYRQLAIRNGIVAFQSRARCAESEKNLKLHFLLERERTKMDVLRHFHVEDSSAVLDSGRVWCGVFYICKSPKSILLVKEWLQCFYDHFEFADDSDSVAPNRPEFIANSHDQSIFSPLCKINGACLLSCGEFVRIRTYMPEGGDKRSWPECWSELKEFPVLAKRDLGKYTRFVECPDWLKPILGKFGRRFASRLYEILKCLFSHSD